MADAVRKIKYCYVMVPNRPGNGARILAECKEEGVNLEALVAFPAKGGKAQVDLIAKDMAGVRRVAGRSGWRLSKIKKGFLVQGTDQIGACHRHLQKLADCKINVVAAQALAAGKGRYAMILWVKPKEYNRAAKTLGAR